MDKLDLSKVPKNLKPNPIFKGLAEHLKDPKVYKETMKKLQDILKSDHKHKTAKEYVKCDSCNAKRLERQKKMDRLGFKSISQFMEWRKIMEIMINKKNFQLK